MGTTYTLTGDLADMFGADVKSVSGYIRTNLPAGTALIDTTATADSVRLGTGKLVIAADGTFTATLLGTANTGLNVEANTLRYEVVVEYVDPGSKARLSWQSGFFALTANTDLKDAAAAVDTVAVASASTYALEAKGYRDEAAAITGLTGEDAAIANRINTPGSLTDQALSATYAAVEQVPRFSVTAYREAGDTTWNAAINRAHAAITAAGDAGVLEFPGGDYQITPAGITWPQNITWQGLGRARIYTAETALYNVLVTASTIASARFRDLIFDQTGDAAQTPSNAGPLNLCTLLHINNVPEVEVTGCTFLSYGIVACLVQSSNASRTKRAVVQRNKITFTRKTNTTYDVSNFNVNAEELVFTNNEATCVAGAGVTKWKARTGAELWAPSADISANVFRDCEIGVLHGPWPALWGNTFDANYKQTHQIARNGIHGCLIGVSLWASGDATSSDCVFRNINVANNTISMHVDATYMPVQGVQFLRGYGTAAAFSDVSIADNSCITTWAGGVTVASKRNVIPGPNSGFVSAYTDATITGLNVHDNRVENFPFGFLTLYRKSNSSGANRHKNITVHSNVVIDAAYVDTLENSTYSPEYTAANSHGMLLNVGAVTDVVIRDNLFRYSAQVCVGLLSTADYITRLVASRNETTTHTTGLWFSYLDAAVFKAQSLDWSVLRPVMDTPTRQSAYTTTSTKPVGIFAASDVAEYVGSASIGKRGWLCTAAASTKTHTGVLTYSNARQAFASVPATFTPGDLILTPAGETVLITRVSGSYIYTFSDMTPWAGTTPAVAAPGTWADIIAA